MVFRLFPGAHLTFPSLVFLSPALPCFNSVFFPPWRTLLCILVVAATGILPRRAAPDAHTACSLKFYDARKMYINLQPAKAQMRHISGNSSQTSPLMFRNKGGGSKDIGVFEQNKRTCLSDNWDSKYSSALGQILIAP